MSKRLRIKKDTRLICFDDVAYNDRPVAAWLANMKLILADFDKPEYHDAVLEVQMNHEGPDDIYVVSFRDETDKEMEKRLLRQKNANFRAKQAREKAKADKKQEELRELSRLKAKYEKSSGVV